MPSLQPTCPDCAMPNFELYLLKDEGLGVAKCTGCDRDYLLLDSGDYWFDVIQAGYPRITRCACKATGFRLRLEYSLRDDGDVSAIKVDGTCSACKKSRALLRFDIDYSPTDQLLKRPLTYCKNPKILFDLHQVSLYVTRADMARLLEFLVNAGASHLSGCLREKDEWVYRPLNLASARQLLLSRGSRYMWIYASAQPLAYTPQKLESARSEASYWKRAELLRFSPPTQMVFGSLSGKNGLLFYLDFSNEYVRGERVRGKSPEFRQLTARLIGWLSQEFVSWRGRDCFDNPREHTRLFGQEFRAKAKKRSR